MGNNIKDLIIEIDNSKLTREQKLERLKSIGRTMPFGKHKGESILYLLVKHYKYMEWVVNNTQFKLNEVEKWWDDELSDRMDLQRVDNILYGLNKTASKMEVIDSFPETNPHWVVE